MGGRGYTTATLQTIQIKKNLKEKRQKGLGRISFNNHKIEKMDKKWVTLPCFVGHLNRARLGLPKALSNVWGSFFF